MDAVQQRLAAKDYLFAWIESGDEKQDARTFWRALLQNVYGIAHPGNEVLFEHPIKNDQACSTIFIDGQMNRRPHKHTGTYPLRRSL